MLEGLIFASFHRRHLKIRLYQYFKSMGSLSTMHQTDDMHGKESKAADKRFEMEVCIMLLVPRKWLSQCTLGRPIPPCSIIPSPITNVFVRHSVLVSLKHLVTFPHHVLKPVSLPLTRRPICLESVVEPFYDLTMFALFACQHVAKCACHEPASGRVWELAQVSSIEVRLMPRMGKTPHGTLLRGRNGRGTNKVILLAGAASNSPLDPRLAHGTNIVRHAVHLVLALDQRKGQASEFVNGPCRELMRVSEQRRDLYASKKNVSS